MYAVDAHVYSCFVILVAHLIENENWCKSLPCISTVSLVARVLLSDLLICTRRRLLRPGLLFPDKSPKLGICRFFVGICRRSFFLWPSFFVCAGHDHLFQDSESLGKYLHLSSGSQVSRLEDIFDLTILFVFNIALWTFRNSSS